jgi:hypothetical protein
MFGRMEYFANTHTHTHTHSLARNLLNIFLIYNRGALLKCTPSISNRAESMLHLFFYHLIFFMETILPRITGRAKLPNRRVI